MVILYSDPRMRGGRRGGHGGRGGHRGMRGDPNATAMPHISDRNPLDMFTNLFQAPRAAAEASDEHRRFGKVEDKRHSYESDQLREGGDQKNAVETSAGTPDVSSLLALATKLGLLPSSTVSKTDVKEGKNRHVLKILIL
jgi:hypothetical protein